MGCFMFGCLTAPFRWIFKIVWFILKMIFKIILFIPKMLWKLITLPFRLFKKKPESKPPEPKE